MDFDEPFELGHGKSKNLVEIEGEAKVFIDFFTKLSTYVKETYNKIYDTNKSINKILKVLKKKNEDTIKKLNSNIKELVEKYKDIPMYTTSYPFESEISFNDPIYKFNFF